MDSGELRRRLDRLVQKTKSAAGLMPPAWWAGDKAGEQRARDDFKAGRIFWMEANHNAQFGLEALDRGKHEMAEAYLWVATDFYIEAIECRLRPSDRTDLNRVIRRRGRPLGARSKKGRIRGGK